MDLNINDFDNFVFDLDGTLYNEQKVVLDSSKEIIKRLQKLGKNVFTATGRTYYMNKKLIADLNITNYMLCSNGWMIYDPVKDKLLSYKAISDKAIKHLLDYADKNNLDYVMYTDKEMRGHNVRNTAWMTKRVLPNVVKNNPYRWDYLDGLWSKDIPKIKVSKISFLNEFYEPKFSEYVKNKLIKGYEKDLVLIMSQPGAIEFMPTGISKGDALIEVAKIKHLDLKRTCAFGDAMNDNKMLEVVGCGVAMGNAQEGVKKIAKYITRSNDDGGIAYFINQLFDNAE